MNTWQFDFDKWTNKTAVKLRNSIARPTVVHADTYRDWIDIKQLLKNLEYNVEQIAKEEVVCRRKNKQTDKHKILIQSHKEMHENLTQMLMMFKLIHG